MTVEKLLELARKHLNDPLLPLMTRDIQSLLRGIVDNLGAAFPCGGWSEPEGKMGADGKTVEWELQCDKGLSLDVDEARGLAVAILRACDSADAKEEDHGRDD